MGWVEYLIVRKLHGAHLEGREVYILLLELVLDLLGKEDVYLHRMGASPPSQNALTSVPEANIFISGNLS